MTNTKSNTSAPASVPPVPTRITLSQVIAALHMLNVNVESPVEEMDRAEASEAADPMDSARAEANLAAGADINGAERATLPDGRPVPIFSSTTTASPWIAGAATAPSTTAAAPPTVAATIPSVTATPVVATPAAAVPSVTATPVAATPAAGSTGGGDDGSTGGTTINGFVCASCNAYNLLRPATSTWYTVVAGRNVGVFQGWHSVQALVSGVPHASYRKYPSEEAAREAFEDAMTQGLVVIIN